MSETISENTQDPGEQVGDETPVDEFKSEESKQAVLADLAKEREQRKQYQAQVEQFEKEREDAEKAKLSDIERAQAEAQEAAKRAESAERELLRVRVASAHGITDQDDIELFLTGSDEETITRQAKRLAERRSNEGPTTPKPDRTQGASGTPTPTSNADLFAQQLGGF